MEDTIHAQAKIAKEHLDKLLDAGKITNDYYNKGIVAIAYDFALNGLPDDCLLMLFHTTPDFLLTVNIEDNFAESEFFNKCKFILEILDFTGFAPYDIMATQPEGEA